MYSYLLKFFISYTNHQHLLVTTWIYKVSVIVNRLVIPLTLICLGEIDPCIYNPQKETNETKHKYFYIEPDIDFKNFLASSSSITMKGANF